MTGELRVSLVATVLNEADSVEAWLESILQQTRLPDEIVIVDGGSTDRTQAIIKSYQDDLPIKLLVKRDINISMGRNAAIDVATYPIIACTDAGTRLDRNWLARIVSPFEQHADVGVVSGFFEAEYDPTRPFEVAMSAAVLPMLHEIDPACFLPSSRSVAYLKSAWERVGGYPEWLSYSEDLVYDIRLKALNGDFAFAPDAKVYFKPRTTIRSYVIQYYRYATGDGHANLWFKRHLVRYGTYLVLLPVIVLAGIIIHPLLWGLTLVGGIIYLYPMYRRLPHYWGDLAGWQKLSAIGWVALIRIVGDIAKMIGYPVGWWQHVRHPRPPWRV